MTTRSQHERPYQTLQATTKLVFNLIAAFLIVGLIGLAGWYIQLPVGASLANDTIAEPLVGAERAVIELDLGAGRLQLEAGSGEQMLSGRVQTLIGVETLERTAGAQGGAMVYRLLSDAPNAVREPTRWPEWTLNVNPDVPLELTVRGGAGPSTLDLRGLNLTDFRLEAQTGRYTVLFPRTEHLDAVVEGGVSRTTLVVPRGVALELTMQPRGVGHIEFGGQVYRRAATFTSPDYDTATQRFDLAVSSDLANVVIERH